MPTGASRQTHVSEDPLEIAEVRRLFPDALDYVDVYDRAGGWGADHPRPCDPPLRPGARQAGRDRHTRRSLSGVEPVHRRRGDAARQVYRGRPSRSAWASDALPAAGGLDLLGDAGRCLRPDGAPLARERVGAILDPLHWPRHGDTRGCPRPRAGGDRIGSLEEGKEADLIAVDPTLVAALPGAPADDEAVEVDEQAHLRAHPGMVRGAWVRGRCLEGRRTLGVDGAGERRLASGTAAARRPRMVIGKATIGRDETIDRRSRSCRATTSSDDVRRDDPTAGRLEPSARAALVQRRPGGAVGIQARRSRAKSSDWMRCAGPASRRPTLVSRPGRRRHRGGRRPHVQSCGAGRLFDLPDRAGHRRCPHGDPCDRSAPMARYGLRQADRRGCTADRPSRRQDRSASGSEP